MTVGKFAAKLTVKFDKLLQRDEHVIFTVYGDSLEELNTNAKDLIGDYKAYNNIEGVAQYYLGDQPGSVASTLDAIGHI